MWTLKNTGHIVNMGRRKNRQYVSPAREKQAAATRSRIIDAAAALLLEKGFAGMTVAEVARRAGVSPQTVYAVFSSKAGIIIAAIEDRMFHDERNLDAVRQMRNAADPVPVLRGAAKLIRNFYEGNVPAFTAVYGTRLVSPRLAELEKELSDLRRERQAPLAETLVASGRLLPHLDGEAVRDLLWVLSGSEIYHLLVVRRGWSPDRYEEQLAALLIASLVRPDAAPPIPPERHPAPPGGDALAAPARSRP
jgi:AcrR family transcriptional regulator